MEPTFQKAALMLGGNTGNIQLNFETAQRLLLEKAGEIEAVSSVYNSEPWGLSEQPEFINQALIISTLLQPLSLLEVCNEIEMQIGKNKTEVNGPRSIDIDILLYSDMVIQLPGLTIPHPRLHLRKFNLLPLAEIAPDWIHPLLHTSIRQLLKNCTDSLHVEKTAWNETE